MFIPINTKEGNLGLSVLNTKKGYSVAIVETCNYMLDTIPSYLYNNYLQSDDDFKHVICTTDYKVINGPDLCDCIEKCLQQIMN